MKHRTLLTAGILSILALAAAVSAAGLMPWGDAHPATFVSLQSGWVQLDGQGLYARDSVSVAAQGRASDLVPVSSWGRESKPEATSSPRLVK